MAKRLSKRGRYKNLPPAIRKAQLVNWKLKNGRKVPVDSDGYNLPDLNDNPKTIEFHAAVGVVESGAADGIGLPIYKSPFCALDIDHCVINDVVAPWAMSFIRECDSYAEFSPSGTGVHILLKGTPKCRNARRLLCGNGHVDIFASNGYITLSGKPVPGFANKPLRLGKKLVPTIYKRIRRWSPAIKKVLAHPVMRDLWDGKWEGHFGSQSEADLSLLSFIARCVDSEPTLIEEVFTVSGLCRSKWRRRADYRERSIRKVVEGRNQSADLENDENYILDRLVRVSDEKAGNVKWLWRYRFPIGSLSAIAGDPEAGKGTSYCSLIAAVTTGGLWPGSTERAPKGPVVIFTTEDDIATVIKPRLIAAGGDPSKVYVLQQGFTFKHDRPAFERLLQTLKPIWVIFDPGKPYIGGLRNSNDDAEIRAILDPVALLVAKHQVACTFIHHLTKDEGRELVHRLVGSIAHIAYPRAVWAVGENPRHRGQPRIRGFMPLKNNLYDRHRIGGLEFTIGNTVAKVDGKVITDVPRAIWRDEIVMMVAEKYFEKPKGKKRTAAQRDAEDILEEHGNEMSTVALRELLLKKGHSERTVRRAIDDMDIVRVHSGRKQRGQHRVKLRKRKMPK